MRTLDPMRIQHVIIHFYKNFRALFVDLIVLEPAFFNVEFCLFSYDNNVWGCGNTVFHASLAVLVICQTLTDSF